jgi:HD superfamily phosphohydrolase
MYKTLYSGEVDADRLDYVRRDIFSTGVAATTYDLGRILDACHLRKNGDQIELGLDAGCLSALEVFFGARFHLYRWVIYHHDVVRRNLAVQRFILTLLGSSGNDSTKNVLACRDNFRKKALGGTNYDEYLTFVDGNFFDLLWSVYSDIQRRMPDCNQREKDMHLFSSIIIQRDNGRLRSLWKRPDDYNQFCRSLLQRQTDKKKSAVAQVNERLRQAYEPIAADLESGIARLRFGMKLEEEIKTHLKGDQRVFVYYIGSFRAAPDESFYLSGKDRQEPTYIDEVSPTLSALRTAWEQCPQMMLFYEISDNNRSLNTKSLNSIYSEAVRHGLRSLKSDVSK